MVLLESEHLSILDLTFLSDEESCKNIEIAIRSKRILHMMKLRKKYWTCQASAKNVKKFHDLRNYILNNVVQLGG